MQLAAILAEGFIAHVMILVLNRPVSAPECGKVLGLRSGTTQTGNTVSDLVHHIAGAQINGMLSPAHHLLPAWPVHVLAQLSTGLQRALFLPPMRLVVHDMAEPVFFVLAEGR